MQQFKKLLCVFSIVIACSSFTATLSVAAEPPLKSTKTVSRQKSEISKRHSRQKTRKRHSKKQRQVVVTTASFKTMPSSFGKESLGSRMDSTIQSGGRNAAVAVIVKSMRNGEILYSRNPYQTLTPASTMKLFTAEAALLYLGPNYRFSTQLLSNARQTTNGVLSGDVFVLLSGDPTLTYQEILDLGEQLRAKGITAIQGNVYIDNTAYDQKFYGPGWMQTDKNYCYGAPISAGIVNKNCLSFGVTPTRPGETARLLTSSKYFYPNVNNSVTTRAGHTRSCRLSVAQNNGSINLDGCMPAGRYTWGVSTVVADVPEFNRQLIKNLFQHYGIRVYGSVTFQSVPQGLTLIAEHQSQPLSELVNQMLKKSDNVIAGALFKKVGQQYTHQSGSWENGSYAVNQILSQQAKLNLQGIRLVDGSGLSPANLASPYHMMEVLNYAFHDGKTGTVFIDALPISGVDGTLKSRMRNLTRKVYAKTGTISGVVSLAGYTRSAEGEPLAFVVMVNGSRGLGWRYRALEDNLVTLLAKYRR